MNALAAHLPHGAGLIARRAGILTYQSPVVYMRVDCEICRSEGFEAQTRVEIEWDGRTVIATVHHVAAEWLGHGEAGLSEPAWRALGLSGGEMLAIRHPPVLESERHIRGKTYGAPLDYEKLKTIMLDVAAGRLSDLHLASFVTATAGGRMSHEETVALTRAMIDVGERLHWPFSPVMDKHCVGGLPGNRTTPLVVAIVTACGLVMPKTSSRAITSPAGTADTMETLAPVNLDLQAGEIVTLMGPSGSGKSTVSRLAARFWDADAGQVLLGGVDVTTVEPETLFKNYAIVFQDVTLFDDSVMENIRLGRAGATDEEVLAAARAAQCEEFVSRLPGGYYSNIGENGCALSGGERQRISIARAILKDAPVVILDEATASMDAENENLVQQALSVLLQGKTVLVIAHRMRTIANVDKVVVLEQGRVAETGTPEELLNQKGLFYRLAEAQTVHR